MKPQFHGKLKDGKFSLNRPQVFTAYCKGRPDGNYYLELTKVKGEPKTNQQLAYYYAVIIPAVFDAMKEAGNENYVVKIGSKFKELPLTEDVVDYLLKQACQLPEKSKASISKIEAIEFIDRCIRWAARYLGCVIPEPNTNWKENK
jgi:hypothetical protein